ncbi:MAG: RtcB family protein [Deltaproteobacteria bacterium]|nr:MAG: RtcB family protein [Deltaproteobacteria bacterium]
MNRSQLTRVSELEWMIEPRGRMRVPGVIYASEQLIEAMDDKVAEQVRHVAELPGIVGASFAMPDAHWGYGFPIGGVAAFDSESGVVSAGGVGFDISCGVRCLLTGVEADRVVERRSELADALFATVPAGVGSRGRLRLDDHELDAMLTGGAVWAVDRGYGSARDLDRIEDGGCVRGARPEDVSARAKERQRQEMGTLGSGNHYLEVQRVAAVYARELAAGFGLVEGQAVVSIHCGSRGLGHQIGTDYLKRMAVEAARHGIRLPDRELACAPLGSKLGRSYLGAMRAAMNCALANRQIITHLTRTAFADVFPDAELEVLYDVSHNTCKAERHTVEGREVELFVHRKGATRAFGPGHDALPQALRPFGQPVLIGGTMGTASFILAGTGASMEQAFGSACHGAGRAMSRRQATKRWKGRDVVHHLASRGIEIRSPSLRGVAEEAPGAYKDVSEVVEAAAGAGLARIVARLEPIVCVKG